MSDDKTDRGPQDRSRINLSEAYEVRYWTQELGVTREVLEEAVAAAGSSTDKVREYQASGS